MNAIPVTIIRGGTSKGVFILERDLPTDPAECDRVLLALMGSPDPRQINGLGGADPLTSKVVVVSPSSRPNIDVEYESIEVGVGESVVNHGIMCGNLIAGAGYFALNQRLIEPQFPVTTVRIYCRSNQKTIIARVPLAHDGEVGSLGTSSDTAAVQLNFERPEGAVTGTLLPAGEPVSSVTLGDGQTIRFSAVDAGTLYAFVRADSLGLTGAEDPLALDANVPFRRTMEAARVAITDYVNARRPPRALPNPRRLKLAIVAAPTSEQADVVARVINPAKVHKAYAVSGAICLATAAVIRGTVVNEIVTPRSSPCRVRIAHPTGLLTITAHYVSTPQGVDILGAELERSTRVLMQGIAYPPSAN